MSLHEDLGAVDWIEVEFSGELTDEIAQILRDYVDRGVMQILSPSSIQTVESSSTSSDQTKRTTKERTTMAPTQETDTFDVDAKNLRGMHHAEIIVFTKDEDGLGAFGVLYNNIGLTDTFTDDEFDAHFRSLDREVLAKEFDADAVWLNGPRRSVMDRLKITVLEGGNVTMVGAIPMQTIGTMHFPNLDGLLAGGVPPYTAVTVGRSTEEFFDAGQQVYQLVSPVGDVYCMHSASQKVDPDIKPDTLSTLGDRLQLPEGWEYRTPTLEEDLVIRAHRGGSEAHIVLDEYENNYQRIDG